MQMTLPLQAELFLHAETPCKKMRYQRESRCWITLIGSGSLQIAPSFILSYRMNRSWNPVLRSKLRIHFKGEVDLLSSEGGSYYKGQAEIKQQNVSRRLTKVQGTMSKSLFIIRRSFIFLKLKPFFDNIFFFKTKTHLILQIVTFQLKICDTMLTNIFLLSE